MDRLKAFVESNLLSYLSATEKLEIRVVGTFLPILLFLDNIQFVITDVKVV